jgi:prepilin-type processing-associated H-X9-DG protein
VELACGPPGGTRGGGGWGFPENTYLQRACSAIPSSGGTAMNGVIFPINKLDLANITDGTSKTIMYGELSWAVAPQAPWLVGSTSKDNTGDVPKDEYTSSNGFVYNAKVLRWPLNARKNSEPDESRIPELVTDPVNGYVPFTEESFGSNHPGGANLGMCDGSAGFVSDDTDVTVLRAMASRASEDLYEPPF